MTSRESGLRRVGGITAALAAAGVAGTVLVACAVGNQSSSTDTSSTSSTSSSSTSDSSSSGSDYSGSVTDGGSSSGQADASTGGS
ncbi:hypothetical protein [Actinophytocola sp.]|uniref:hypothetical protein n=1 Tax=Actinophytocola sp. TaxID=1872138 RepID=UPI002ED4102C